MTVNADYKTDYKW